MPRVTADADVFSAIAEPRRRQIIDLLAKGGSCAVGDIVTVLKLPQPAVSKHLSVLRKLDLVSVRKQGQQRHYQLNAHRLKPVHDWVKAYERFWDHQLGRIRQRAERQAGQRPTK
ncbi:MAG: metalloregulator ArsR/SmtB family transcription factor [Pirellulales bacterium]|nr:metalloregulator ArsR/SmtB family transcription factor [Pirellulales bacterium]